MHGANMIIIWPYLLRGRHKLIKSASLGLGNTVQNSAILRLYLELIKYLRK